MMPVERLTQTAANDVRINFGCGEVGMPKHRLDAPEVRAAFEEMRSEGVTQNVRREVVVDPSLAAVDFNGGPESLPRERTAAGGYEYVR
jgi:hypothetical protein